MANEVQPVKKTTNLLGQITFPLMGGDNHLDQRGALVVATFYGLLGVVIGSKMARSRAEKGLPPVLGMFG